MPTSSNGSGRHFSENSLTIMDHHDPSLPGSYQEYCEEPPEDHSRGSNGTKDSKGRKKAHLKDGEEAETVVFLNGSVEPGGGTCAWYRMVVCRVLTCGLYRVCQRTILAPCLSGPQDPPENKECSKGEEEEVEDVMEEVKERDDHQDELAWLEDVHFDGVKVDIHRGDLSVVTQAPSSSYGRPPPSGRPEQQQHRTSFRSYDSVTLDDWEEEVRGEEVYSGEGVDALIHKKLLALYTAYQIEELARCTTDSVFVRKSKEIHQLINSLAEEHQMDEQEAECRLVRGIIRISTRRSKKRAPPHYADSGNETMRNSDDSSCSNNSRFSLFVYFTFIFHQGTPYGG